MAWEISDLNIGDEVTITVTVLKMLDDGRASVSIPSCFPLFDTGAEKTKAGEELELRGEITRVDEDVRQVTVKAGGLITVDADAITAWNPAPRKRAPLRDTSD